MKKNKANNSSTASCLMFVFVYWWLYPLKWIFYNLPKKILSSISRNNNCDSKANYSLPAITYENNKKYGDYAVTQTGMFLSHDVENQIESFEKQAQDRKRLCETTTDPLVFFYSYDFMIKRFIDIMNLSQYADIPEIPAEYASSEYSYALSIKQKAVHDLIDRCKNKYYDKIKSLKTTSAKMKYADKFSIQFHDYEDEISAENREFITDSTEYLYFIAGK